MELYKFGSRGEIVKQIQRALQRVGYGVIDDGVFGNITREAVMAFQSQNGLTPDGVVGPATLAKLLPSAVANAFKLKRSERTITDIIIHCTATPEGVAKTVEQIRNEHKEQGWSDIGYHYIVTLDGKIEQGRDVDFIGAHCSGFNAHSIGVAYVGGLENKPGVPYAKQRAKDTRTDQQKAALLSLLLDLRKFYPTAVIKGHRDYSPDKNHNGIVEPWEWIKDCPSFDAAKEYRRI